MSHNSFLLKGWNVTLIAVLFTLAVKDTNKNYFIIAFIPVIVFWILDSYYLSLERSFRGLFNKVRTDGSETTNFSMDIKEFREGKNSWGKSFFSKTILIFYLSIIFLMLLVMYLI